MKILDVEIKKPGIGYVVGARTTMTDRNAAHYEKGGFIKVLGEHKPEGLPKENKKAPEGGKK